MTDHAHDVHTPPHAEASASAPTPCWCLWCGMEIVTEADATRHRETCPTERGEAPTPAEYIGAIRAGRRPPQRRGGPRRS
jgi:hypothetical protein